MPVLPTSALGPKAEVAEPTTAVVELLGVLRRHLDMDLAWLGRIESDVLVLQALSGDAASFQLAPGSTVRRGGGLFGRILSGELPGVIPDTYANPRTAGSAVVEELGIGAYLAAPVVDGDGAVYGMLGCLSHTARPALRTRDGRFVRMLTEILGDSVTDPHRMWELRSRVWRDVSRVLDQGGPDLAFQPVFDLERGRIIGVEALSRFPGNARSTLGWFTAAGDVGLNVDLELAAIRRALAVLPDLPAGMVLAINASPSTLCAGLVEMLVHGGADTDRLLVEITEHEQIGDVPAVLRDITRLRRLGVRIAADDVGSGYAGLEQLVRLRPEIIKMDCSLTQNIDADPARRAVAAGLVHVAEEIGGAVVAEGIERAGELRAAREIAMRYGQGYFLGRPTPLLREACAAGD